MPGPFYILPEHKHNAAVRENAARAVAGLDLTGRWKVSITIAEGQRTLDQNAKMWAMLTDISKQVCWHGQYLAPEEWKDMATAALKRYKVVPGIDGGFVVIGARTSKMSIKAMIEVIDFLDAFGGEHQVKWTEKARAA